MEHMKKNNLFSHKQYEFITGRLTSLQLLQVLYIWTQVLGMGIRIDIIYMEFMKAFAQVPYRSLVGKIKCYEIDSDNKVG